MPDLKKVTIAELKSALQKVDNARSDLETTSDPVFDEDPSDMDEVLDKLEEAATKLRELVGEDD